MNPFETLTSETTKLVYLYLREHGTVTADELSATLHVPLLKLLPVLRTLENRSLVARTDDGYTLAERAERTETPLIAGR